MESKIKLYRVEFTLEEFDRSSLIIDESLSLIFNAENEEQAKEQCKKTIKDMGFTVAKIIRVVRLR